MMPSDDDDDDTPSTGINLNLQDERKNVQTTQCRLRDGMLTIRSQQYIESQAELIRTKDQLIASRILSKSRFDKIQQLLVNHHTGVQSGSCVSPPQKGGGKTNATSTMAPQGRPVTSTTPNRDNTREVLATLTPDSSFANFPSNDDSQPTGFGTLIPERCGPFFTVGTMRSSGQPVPYSSMPPYTGTGFPFQNMPPPSIPVQQAVPAISPVHHGLTFSFHNHWQSSSVVRTNPYSSIVSPCASNQYVIPRHGIKRPSVGVTPIKLESRLEREDAPPTPSPVTKSLRYGASMIDKLSVDNSSDATKTSTLPRKKSVFDSKIRACQTFQECMLAILDGEVPDVAMKDLRKVKEAQKAFAKQMYGYSMFFCEACRECRIIDTTKSKSNPLKDNSCERCIDDIKARGIRRFTAINDMDPIPPDVRNIKLPQPTLNEIEEMLVARAFPIMSIYRLDGGMTSHKGGILNVEQKVDNLLTRLPSRIKDLPIILVKHPRYSKNKKKFRVRRKVIAAWLLFLKHHHPEYKSVTINEDNLLSLPVDDYVDDDLKSVTMEFENETTEQSDKPKSEQDLGPECDGATGMPAGEEEPGVTYIPLPDTETEEIKLKRTIQEVYKYDLEWPEQGQMLSDYDTPGLQGLIFPSLFPFGAGDVFSRDRQIRVTETEAMNHYLNYAVQEERGAIRFPFAEHPRWPHWAQNTISRHRTIDQRKVYISKNPKDCSMTHQELRQAAKDNSEEIRGIFGRMHSYHANINGSPSYLNQGRRNLEALMEVEGWPTCFITLTGAFNQWDDLHKLFQKLEPAYESSHFKSLNEIQRTAFKRSMVRRYSHIADHYFLLRTRCLMNTVFGGTGIRLNYSMLRTEYQSRGGAHVHGVLQLASAPVITDLSERVLKGRLARRQLQDHNRLPLCDFPKESLSCDEYITSELEEEPPSLSTEMFSVLNATVADGVAADKCIGQLNDWLIDNFHPEPPMDANLNDRDNDTFFRQTIDNQHPAAINFNKIRSQKQLDVDYSNGISCYQRHAHSAYCLKAGDCRMHFPRWDRPLRSHVQVLQRENKKSHSVSMEMNLIEARNDNWLNPHMRALTEIWNANTDVRLVIDPRKVSMYLLKYVTKAEPGGAFTDVLYGLMNKGKGTSTVRDTKSILLDLMLNINKNVEVTRPQCLHFLNNLPIIEFSHGFVTIDLSCRQTLLDFPEPPPKRVKTDCGSRKVNPNKKNEKEKKMEQPMTTLEAYGNRLDEDVWMKPDSDYCRERLVGMTLPDFCKTFYVGKNGDGRGKIRLHQKKRMVPKFYPSIPLCRRGHRDYTMYCRVNLMKYSPWTGEPEQFYTATDENIHLQWERYFAAADGSKWKSDINFIDRKVDVEGNKMDKFGDVETNPNFVPTKDATKDASWTDINNAPVKSIRAIDPEAQATIQFDPNHDFSNPIQQYESSEIAAVETKWEQVKSSSRARQRTIVHIDVNSLNQEQRTAHDAIVDATVRTGSASESLHSSERLFIIRGVGGTGKSHTINCVMSTLITKHSVSANQIMLLAPTGKAASVIGGCTIFDYQEGLCLPVSKEEYKPLCSKTLKRFQEKMGRVRLIFIDEYSMIRPRELAFIDWRLREGTCSSVVFGGYVIVLCGDPGQLPPVCSPFVLWDDPSKKNKESTPTHADTHGMVLYRLFVRGVKLVKNQRIDPNDTDSSFYVGFLLRLRDGEVTKRDWKILKSRCSKSSMTVAEWTRRFDSPGVTHLFPANAQVNSYNAQKLMEVGNPVKELRAEHSNVTVGRKLSDKKFRGLENAIHICVGASVMLTNNVATSSGLVNGASGIIVDILMDPTSTMELPKYIVIDFDCYNGPAFFEGAERSNWVPLPPSTFTAYVQNESISRTQFPIRLSYAMTIHKAQGQTFKSNIVVDMGNVEKTCGQTYVALSRSIKMRQIGITGGLTLGRLTTQITKHNSLKVRLQEEERLDALTERNTTPTHEIASKEVPIPSSASEFPVFWRRQIEQCEEELLMAMWSLHDENQPVATHLSSHDFCTLKPKAWLNDAVMDAFIRFLRPVSEHVRIFHSHFFTEIYGYTRDLDYGNCKDYKNVIHRLPDNVYGSSASVATILVPIMHARSHWAFIEVDFLSREIVVRDSMDYDLQRYMMTMFDLLVEKYKSHDGFDPSSWTMHSDGQYPKQHNGYDCGVFTLVGMYLRVYGLRSDCFGQEDIALCRKRIAVTVLNDTTPVDLNNLEDHLIHSAY